MITRAATVLKQATGFAQSKCRAYTDNVGGGDDRNQALRAAPPA